MSSNPNADDLIIAAQCTAEDVTTVPSHLVEEGINDALRHLAFDRTERAGAALVAVLDWIHRVEAETPWPCEWEGSIDSHTENGSTWTWTCPQCGTTHSEER